MTRRVALAALLAASSCAPATVHTEARPTAKVVEPTTTTTSTTEVLATTTTTGPPLKASRSWHRPAGSGGDIWAALARCESGNTNDAGAPYFGYFQFSAATWRSMGLDGTADQYPYDAQLDAAKRLQARSGWSQWPTCARKLGLP